MCSPSDLSSPVSEASNSASNGQASGPCDGKSSATSSASGCSPSTGQTHADTETSGPPVPTSRRSTSSAEGSHVKMSPAQAAALVLAVTARDCGPSSLVLSPWSDQKQSLSRTSLVGRRYGSTQWCETWSSAAMTRFRSRLRRLMLGPLTRARGSSSLRATLTAKGNLLSPSMQKWKGHHAFRKWVGRPLNPAWCEWDMGFPEGWTDLGSEPSETRSSHSARKSRGTSSESSSGGEADARARPGRQVGDVGLDVGSS